MMFFRRKEYDIQSEFEPEISVKEEEHKCKHEYAEKMNDIKPEIHEEEEECKEKREYDTDSMEIGSEILKEEEECKRKREYDEIKPEKVLNDKNIDIEIPSEIQFLRNTIEIMAKLDQLEQREAPNPQRNSSQHPKRIRC